MTEAPQATNLEQEPASRTPAQIEAEIKELTKDRSTSQDLKWIHDRTTHLKDGAQLVIAYTEDSPREISSEFIVRKIFPDHSRKTPHTEEYKWPAGSYTNIDTPEQLGSIGKIIDLLKANIG